MKIILKTPQSTQELIFDEIPTIKDIRESTAMKFQAPTDQVCLITKGKIMKDAESSSDYNLQDGSTIHVVILKQKEKSAQAQSSPIVSNPVSNPAPALQQQTFSTENQQSNPFSLGMPGYQNILNDPSVVRHLLDNPAIQNLMSDPVFMETVINSHPTLKTLCENNPEVMRIFQDPATSKMLIEMMKNPNMYNEMLRSQDRVLAQLENIPGAYNQISGLLGQLNSFDSPNRYSVQRNTDNSSTISAPSTNISGEPLPNFDQGGSQPSRQVQGAESATNNMNIANAIEKILRSNQNPDSLGILANESEGPTMLRFTDPSGSSPALENELNSRPSTRQALIQLVDAAGAIKQWAPNVYNHLGLPPGLPNAVVPAYSQITPPKKAEETFAVQLEQLNNMGFYDKEECLEALVIFSGDLSRAVDWLLSRNR